MSWRFTPWDFEVAKQTRERYGAKKMQGLQLQDWGVTYDEMAPFYDRFERIAGTSGIAGNLNGQPQKGGNIFEGPRSRDYPTPPLKDTHWMSKYRKTTESMGYHPFTVPAGNLSQAYVNQHGSVHLLRLLRLPRLRQLLQVIAASVHFAGVDATSKFHAADRNGSVARRKA
jgi:gluconate 2-dehydrogenase alpha chain